MLKELVVSNYRSLDRDVRLSLGGLTALVGPNGAGKSNVTDVLQFLSDIMHLGLEGAITKRTGIAAVRRWSSGRPFNVDIRARVAAESLQGTYEFTLTGDRSEEYRVQREAADVIRVGSQETHGYEIRDGVWVRGPDNLRPKVDARNLVLPLVAADERFSGLADELRRMAVYDIFPDALREPRKYDPTKPMLKHGTNWVSILKDQAAETWKTDFVEVLNRLTGDITDVEIKPVGGFLSARFRHDSDSRRSKWFDSAQESNGTLRVAGILTALLQKPTPAVVAIEEPELTVHPGALPLLYDYVREAQERAQVVLTTHSPELLDLIDTGDVRVVERGSDGTRVNALAESQRRSVRDGLLSLGEVLRAEGLQPELPLAGE
jgi:predicted ATPase